MKIVVCFYFQDNSIPLGKDLAAGFAKLGHQVFAFDSSARENRMGAKRLAKSLAKLVGAKRRLSAYFERCQAETLAADFSAFCRQIGPDFILVIRGERIDPDIVSQVAAESGARTAAWWVKNPRWQDTFREEARQFDFAYSIDESVCDEFVRYMPSWAVNREEYFPLAFREKKQRLLFIGAWSARRQQYLEAVGDLPLDIIGPNWKNKLPGSSPLYGKVVADHASQHAMATHYRTAWAVIDIRQIDQSWEQGVNMRFADVPASGTVLVTEPSREVERWGLSARCALLFTSPGELRNQALFVLSNVEACQTMSRNATLTAAEMPGFVDRASAMLQQLASPNSRVDGSSPGFVVPPDAERQ